MEERKHGSFDVRLLHLDRSDEITQTLFHECPEVLHVLLCDQTRTFHENEKARREGREPVKDQWNIIWGTDNYKESAETGFGAKDEITETKITGEFRSLVRPRALKRKDIQKKRAKDMAEVFTPSWVCNAQNNLVDEAWFGRKNVFNREFIGSDGCRQWEAAEECISFPVEPYPTSTRSWTDYVNDTRLEITCGEAPYLVSRHDAVTGEPIHDLNQRIGLLDRKLRVVSENTDTNEDWIKWTMAALMATYGFEWQGDNLLLAREAVLGTVLDFHRDKFGHDPSRETLFQFAYIISWNLWQMDGLKMVLPYSCDDVTESNLMGESEHVKCPSCEKGLRKGHIGVKCLIRDWRKDGDAQILSFEDVFGK